MKATIYHNPMCGTSRKTLDILRDSGCDVWIYDYLNNPPSREELARLYERAGISPREGLRAKEPLADDLGLNRPGVTDDEVLDAMIAHPILINRPIVETPNGVRLCRPQELVREIRNVCRSPPPTGSMQPLAGVASLRWVRWRGGNDDDILGCAGGDPAGDGGG